MQRIDPPKLGCLRAEFSVIKRCHKLVQNCIGDLTEEFHIAGTGFDRLAGKGLVQIAPRELDFSQHPAGQFGEDLLHDLGQGRATDGFQRGAGEKQSGEFLGGGLKNREIRDVRIVVIAVESFLIDERQLELVAHEGDVALDGLALNGELLGELVAIWIGTAADCRMNLINAEKRTPGFTDPVVRIRHDVGDSVLKLVHLRRCKRVCMAASSFEVWQFQQI